MATTPPPTGKTLAPDDSARSLGADLLDAMAAQLDRARQGDVDAVIDLAHRVNEVLARARRAGTRPDPECRRRMLGLHAQIRLVLAQQMDDVARQRARLVRGKRSVQAYRDASG